MIYVNMYIVILCYWWTTPLCVYCECMSPVVNDDDQWTVKVINQSFSDGTSTIVASHAATQHWWWQL